jgi:heme-degrading monooxygenase HmoA
LNQVTELLRLTSTAKLPEAVARLSTLFDLMSLQPGFQSAEIKRSVDEADLLLVVLTWDHLSDWTAFQSSEAKINFAANRPEGLYDFLRCGMNWSVEASAGFSTSGRYLRREVVRGRVAPAEGPMIVLSRVGSYVDYEPEYEGATMRTTWLNDLDTPLPSTGNCEVLSDGLYEALYTFEPSMQETNAAGLTST